MTSALRNIYCDVATGIRDPLGSWNKATTSQKSTGGFGAVASVFDVFSSVATGKGLGIGTFLSSAEGIASFAILFSTNPYLLFGVAAWFCAKGVFSGVTQTASSLSKGDIMGAGMALGKAGLDIAFNCSALKIFKQFKISKILSSTTAARSEASMAKLLISEADATTTITHKLTETTNTLKREALAAHGMIDDSAKAFQRAEEALKEVAKKEAAAVAARETAEKAVKEAAETAKKELAEQLAKAKAQEKAIRLEIEVTESLLKKIKKAQDKSKALFIDRKNMLSQAKKLEKDYRANPQISTAEIISRQKIILTKELQLQLPDFAAELTRLGFGEKEAEAGIQMAQNIKDVFSNGGIKEGFHKAKQAVWAGKSKPPAIRTIQIHPGDNSLPDNLGPLETLSFIARS